MSGPIAETFATPDDFGEGTNAQLHTSLGEQLGAEFSDAFMGGTRTLMRASQMANAEQGVGPEAQAAAEAGMPSYDFGVPDQPQPDVAIADAKARVKQEGLDNLVKLPDQDTIRGPVLDLMLEDGRDRAQYAAAVNRGPQGFIPDALGLVTQIGAGMIDPTNIAAFSIPVLGEARYGRLMASAGESILARAGVRAGVGAAQGAVGGAITAAPDWWLRTQDGQDYTFADALKSVVLSAGMGGTFHAGAGLLGDLYRSARGWPLEGTLEDLRARALAGDVHAADIVEQLGGTGAHPLGETNAAGVDLDEVPGVTAASETAPISRPEDGSGAGLLGDQLRDRLGLVGSGAGLLGDQLSRRGQRLPARALADRLAVVLSAGMGGTEDGSGAGLLGDQLRDRLGLVGSGAGLLGDQLSRRGHRLPARAVADGLAVVLSAGMGGTEDGSGAGLLGDQLRDRLGLVGSGAGLLGDQLSRRGQRLPARALADRLAVVLSAGMGGTEDGSGAGLLGDQLPADTGQTTVARHPAEVLADLPERAQEDVVRASIANVINGDPVQAGELLAEAAKVDPRIAESVNGPPVQAPSARDRAREAAVEAGYLHDVGHISDAEATTRVPDLLNAMDDELRGNRIYKYDRVPEHARAAEAERTLEENRAHAESELNAALSEIGEDPAKMPDSRRERVLEIMTREDERDPINALERAVMEEDLRETEAGKLEPHADQIPGWDVADERGGAPGEGGTGADRDVGQGQGDRGGSRPGGAPDRSSQRGADWQSLKRKPQADEELAQASRDADQAPAPADTPEKAVSAAQAAAAEAEKLLDDILPKLSDDERESFEEALANLKNDTSAREQIVRDGAACLAAASVEAA